MFWPPPAILRVAVIKVKLFKNYLKNSVIKSKRRAKYSVKSHDVKTDVKKGLVGSCVVCLVSDSGLSPQSHTVF
jgi:hypothetical protein